MAELKEALKKAHETGGRVFFHVAGDFITFGNNSEAYVIPEFTHLFGAKVYLAYYAIRDIFPSMRIVKVGEAA